MNENTLIDHQGNLTATICGSTVERLGYDVWGRRRNPVGFGYGNVSHTFDRGYTLHEHYDDFGLINMNGRLYDPVLGRMLSPDIAIRDGHNAQAYNRYSYCFNNPLRFTDPSGYVVRGTSSLFRSSTFLFYEIYNNKGVFFNTDEALGQQLPKIEPFGEEEREAYMAYRKEVFSYDTDEYKTIQTELLRLENAEEVFRIRMGNNITRKAGGGNFIYNKETGEFDVNIADYGDFSTMGKIAHELKHADQYMNGEMAFDIRGDGQFGKPIAYDIYDEYDAYKRQSFFDKKAISNEVINDRYKTLIQTRISIDNIAIPYNKTQIIELNNHDYKTKHKKIRFIYHGWKNDIK
ncbi:RHS repeat domain-containing protein [Bacteroides heparinolyticus]|uniref:RHS repeat domain-containing protein n=1 Tax=Prevotella heparinolytica TaxID=28113 RepID=UPI0035A0192F